jgi:Fe-Mn family superoxide dismutase
MEYKTRQFSLPELEGISGEQVKVHLALYEGYVKHSNLIREELKTLKSSEANQYVINELRRRYAFEWNGMRMHEYYFEQFEGDTKETDISSPLVSAAVDKYGSWEEFISHIKEVAGSRGIGWTIVTYDPIGKQLHTTWVNDHELGQLVGLPVILALDMWEHAFMVDYKPATKMEYVDAFFKNLNWKVCEGRFQNATS